MSKYVILREEGDGIYKAVDQYPTEQEARWAIGGGKITEIGRYFIGEMTSFVDLTVAKVMAKAVDTQILQEMLADPVKLETFVGTPPPAPAPKSVLVFSEPKPDVVW